MMEMDLHVSEYLIIFMNNKLEEQVQLDIKLWVLIKKVSKSFQRGSIKIKINIGKKLSQKAIK
jgi:hypothetical protein